MKTKIWKEKEIQAKTVTGAGIETECTKLKLDLYKACLLKTYEHSDAAMSGRHRDHLKELLRPKQPNK